MTYGSSHRFLLRTIASRGVMSIVETEEALSRFSEGSDDTAVSVSEMIREINDEIGPLQQTIKLTNDELTNEEVVIFLSLGFDEATKAQGVFSATELEFFRILIEQIMTTDSRQITEIRAINLVGNMKSSFTKTDAQKLLDTWCRMRYLDKEENNYALGVRTIHEFEGYLRENMPDTIEECCACSQIVFRGYNCPACAKAVHTRCLNRYLEKVDKWPCCKAAFTHEQLEQLNCMELSNAKSATAGQSSPNASQPAVEKESFKNSRTLRSSQKSTSAQEPPESEPTVMEETQEMDISSQDVVPEVSQRITRKRKRQP